MKKNYIIVYLYSALLFVLLAGGCEQRFDLKTLPSPTQVTNPGDTSYVEIYPPWGGFGSPTAVMIGKDQLIYVCDEEKNEVVILDEGGSVLSKRSILHPISIAQNSKLDLYVGAETISPNGTDTIGAVFRIFLARLDTTYISRYDTLIQFGDTIIKPVYRDTSYFANHHLDSAHAHIVWEEAGRPQRRFRGIAIMPDNSYLVARYGPDNSSYVDPDCRVLRFNASDTTDTFLTALGDLVTRPSGGTAITDIRYLTGIMIFPGTRNFLLTQTTDGVAYGVIIMKYTSNAVIEGWSPTYDPSDPATRGTDIIRPYRFQNAVAAAYDSKRREIFVVDAALDSVMKFSSTGKFKHESFGRYISGSDNFPALNNPHGVAFSNDCTLYIADTGNKVIRRFRLSIQTQCIQ
jgi:hypothetical protein